MRKFKHPLGQVKVFTDEEAETLLRIQGKRKGWEEIVEKKEAKKGSENTGSTANKGTDK